MSWINLSGMGGSLGSFHLPIPNRFLLLSTFEIHHDRSKPKPTHFLSHFYSTVASCSYAGCSHGFLLRCHRSDAVYPTVIPTVNPSAPACTCAWIDDPLIRGLICPPEPQIPISSPWNWTAHPSIWDCCWFLFSVFSFQATFSTNFN